MVRYLIIVIQVVLVMALGSPCRAQEDPGRTKMGQVNVSVYHASDGRASGGGAAPAKEVVARMRKEQRLRFKNYRLLGQDTQPLLRSYESWAQPLKPSDEVLLRFEAQGQPTRDEAVLDLELWLARKKIVKTDARIGKRQPLYVLGPEWRGGRLIIAVTLAPDPKAR